MIRLIFEIDSRHVHVNSIACKSLWYEEQIHALLFDFNDSYDKAKLKKSQPIKNLPPRKHTLTSTTIYQYPYIYIYTQKDLWEEQVWGCDTLNVVPATQLFSSESVFPYGETALLDPAISVPSNAFHYKTLMNLARQWLFLDAIRSEIHRLHVTLSRYITEAKSCTKHQKTDTHLIGKAVLTLNPYNIFITLLVPFLATSIYSVSS